MAYHVGDELRARSPDEFNGVEHIDVILTLNEVDHVQQRTEQTTSFRTTPNPTTTTVAVIITVVVTTFMLT